MFLTEVQPFISLPIKQLVEYVTSFTLCSFQCVNYVILNKNYIISFPPGPCNFILPGF